MRFQTEHQLQGTREAVADVLSDPRFYLQLQLPDLSLPTLIDNRTEDAVSSLTLRYEFVGHLDPIARRLLGDNRLAWVQKVQVDHRTYSGSLEFGAEKDPGRLHGSATFVLELDSGTCLRRLEGELVVAVKGVGPMAERRIVPGLVRRLDIEAEALNQRLCGAS